MPPAKIISVHTHLHKSQDVDARVKLWRECGLVKVCVQVLTADPADSTYDNAGVLEWMRKYPDLILVFGYVELGPRPDPPEQVDRLKEQGFTGLKFIAPSEPYGHEGYYPLYERAQALGMPILFHTGFLAVSASDGARCGSTPSGAPSRTCG